MSSSSSTLCQENIHPQILTLKLAPLKSDFTHQSLQIEGTTKRKQNMDGWSFIDSLTTNPTQLPCIAEPYVHPLVKYLTDKLSANSLDMCTEILGDETGSDPILSSDEFSSFLSQLENPRNIDNDAIARKKRSSRSSDIRGAFPPPLTSISSSGKLRLRPHREGGRFVLRPLTILRCKETFHAERSHGRLRLRFNASNFCNEAKEEEGGGGKFEDEAVYEEEVDGKKMYHRAEDNEVDDDDGDDDNEDDEDDMIDIEEKILWTKGCKERAQRSTAFWNWDSYWVATN